MDILQGVVQRMKIIWIALLFCSLAHAQPVYIDNRGGAIPVDLVQYSIWDLNARLGTRMYYAGETLEYYSDTKIIMRKAETSEWLNNNQPLFGGPEAFTHQEPNRTGAVIIFAPIPFIAISSRLIEHELGHALGYWSHSTDSRDTMFSVVGKFGITQHDIALITGSLQWPKPDPISQCHAVLGLDWSLTIPEISGNMARLTYQGNYRWTITEYSQFFGATCAGNVLVDSAHVTLADVRVYGHGSWRASLELVGGVWRLTSLLPN